MSPDEKLEGWLAAAVKGRNLHDDELTSLRLMFGLPTVKRLEMKRRGRLERIAIKKLGDLEELRKRTQAFSLQ